jgi:hypothetical protein
LSRFIVQWLIFEDDEKLFLNHIFSVADPDPGFRIRCLFDPWNRDKGWVKARSGSGMNIPDHISEILEILETIFWVKNTKIL